MEVPTLVCRLNSCLFSLSDSVTDVLLRPLLAVGATQNISIRLTSACRSFGGEALIDATVRQVLIEGGRAVGVLVSNTDELEECTSQEELDRVPTYEIRAKNVVCATSV